MWFASRAERLGVARHHERILRRPITAAAAREGTKRYILLSDQQGIFRLDSSERGQFDDVGHNWLEANQPLNQSWSQNCASG